MPVECQFRMLGVCQYFQQPIVFQQSCSIQSPLARHSFLLWSFCETTVNQTRGGRAGVQTRVGGAVSSYLTTFFHVNLFQLQYVFCVAQNEASRMEELFVSMFVVVPLLCFLAHIVIVKERPSMFYPLWLSVMSLFRLIGLDFPLICLGHTLQASAAA